MRPSNYVAGPAALLWTTLGSLAAFAVPVMAADSDSADGDAANSSPAPKAANAKSSSSSKPAAAATTDEAAPTTTTKSSKTSKVSITNTGPLATKTPVAVPTITGGGAKDSNAGPIAFPTLTRNVIPTYPAPTVPPTKNAPFMQQSTLPDGTVFICVGAVLGVLGLAILLWRAIISLLLHRSVKRAAMDQHIAGGKTGFPAPPAPFYKYTDQSSTPSFAAGVGAVPAGRGVRRTTRVPVPSATPSQSNLFFSPTAATSNAAGVRASSYLPSGFYASGSGNSNHTNSISLSNLRPDSRGPHLAPARNTLSQSPPDSPQYPARRDTSLMSPSSLNLTALSPGQRAPSAYLEDLLADDPNALPPPQMPHTHGGRSSSGRTDSLPNRIE
ncbi:CSI2 protein-like protein [Drechmeria coniospora]|uniref:CSI2 protein-like protein n=1 Tax=Drechmeria coniospora TaxID=98403 RepID=A0A151GNM8_DRECN|nr:CSI2 protein-like protein [Drechmeria coniospora]KYK58696.1 CSI2 protein-like protein [Drechmeria coniospora]